MKKKQTFEIYKWRRFSILSNYNFSNNNLVERCIILFDNNSTTNIIEKKNLNKLDIQTDITLQK